MGEWVSEVAQSCPTLSGPMDYSLLGSSVHGIFQARILEWVAISFSRGSSQPRDQTRVSCIVGRRFTVWAMGGNELFQQQRYKPHRFLSFCTTLTGCTWFRALTHKQTLKKNVFIKTNSEMLCLPVTFNSAISSLKSPIKMFLLPHDLLSSFSTKPKSNEHNHTHKTYPATLHPCVSFLTLTSFLFFLCSDKKSVTEGTENT